MPTLETRCDDTKCLIDSITNKCDKQTISCNSPFCKRQFHIQCAGLKGKKVSNIYFLCTACNDYLVYSNAPLQSKLEKLEGQFSELSSSITNQILQLEKQFSADVKELNDKITTVENHCSANSLTVTELNKQLDSLCNKTESQFSELNARINSLENTDINDCLHSNRQSNNAKTKTKSMSFSHENNEISKIFLCSIEVELSKDDVIKILELENISVENLTFEEQAGNFKRKYFLKVSATNVIDLFRFKTSLSQSNLSTTWFVRDSPPKSPKETFNVAVKNDDHRHYERVPHNSNIMKPASNRNIKFNYNKNLTHSFNKVDRTVKYGSLKHNNNNNAPPNFNRGPFQPHSNIQKPSYANVAANTHSTHGEIVPFLENLLMSIKQK